MTCNKSKPIKSQVFLSMCKIFSADEKWESRKILSHQQDSYQNEYGLWKLTWYSDNNEFLWNDTIHIVFNIDILNNILCSKISEFLLIRRCLTFSFNSFKSFILDPMTLFNLVLNSVVTTLIQKWIHNYFRQDFDMLRNLFISYLSVCWKEKVVFKSY